jgi:hypothetical protein
LYHREAWDAFSCALKSPSAAVDNIDARKGGTSLLKKTNGSYCTALFLIYDRYHPASASCCRMPSRSRRLKSRISYTAKRKAWRLFGVFRRHAHCPAPPSAFFVKYHRHVRFCFILTPLTAGQSASRCTQRRVKLSDPFPIEETARWRSNWKERRNFRGLFGRESSFCR